METKIEDKTKRPVGRPRLPDELKKKDLTPKRPVGRPRKENVEPKVKKANGRPRLTEEEKLIRKERKYTLLTEDEKIEKYNAKMIQEGGEIPEVVKNPRGRPIVSEQQRYDARKAARDRYVAKNREKLNEKMRLRAIQRTLEKLSKDVTSETIIAKDSGSASSDETDELEKNDENKN